MEIKLPNTDSLSSELQRLDLQAVVIADAISNHDQYALSGEVLLSIKALRVTIDSTFDPLIGMANELLTQIRLTKSSFSFPLDTLRLKIERHREAFEEKQEAHPPQDADLMEDMGLEVPAASAPPPLGLPRTKGIHSRSAWSAQITSIKELCRAVADGKAPEEYVLGNIPVLNKIASTSKTLMSVPGVKAVNRKSTVVRGKKADNGQP